MNISDDALIETYIKAIHKELDDDFVQLLLKEIKLRGIEDLIEEFK